MSKKLKIILVLIFAFIIFAIFEKCEANSINKISMDIAIDDNGTASVTEIWDCNASQGTEVYHPYYNLGNSTFSNLAVSDNGTDYQTLSSWNTVGTLSSKANKCGIHTISNGIELCWGISQYGTHKYIVKYNISNFVSTLTDSQMIYWTLIPYNFSSEIGSAYIKIHTNFNISSNVGVWGYGNYGGTAYVYNGYIEMQSKGKLSTDQYMTILVQFPSGTFSKNTNKLNNNFNYYLNMAENGSAKYVKSSNTTSSSKFLFILVYIMMVLALFLFYFLINKGVPPLKFYFNTSKSNIKFGIGEKSIPNDIPYFRDIPCDGDLFEAYYIAYQYNILKNKNDIFGAIILKWLKDSLIKIGKKEAGLIFKKENIIIILNETNISSITNKKERQLFYMLKDASKDGILENHEFENWCYSSYSRVLRWFDDIAYEQRDNLVAKGLIASNLKNYGFYSQITYSATSKLKEEAIKLAGLKKFLLDYSTIVEKTIVEVKLFEKYLIFAQIFGIAKQVSAEFKELYPEVIEQSCYQSFDNIVYLNMYTSHWASSAYIAKNQAEARASGGGGFSSGGGGGGSFGGGGGGGGFR